MRQILVTDLDGTLIRTKSGLHRPVSKDDWEFKVDINWLTTTYNKIYIITNQLGFVKFGTYISYVKDKIDVPLFIADKHNRNRKPHSTLYEEFILPHIEDGDHISFAGDMETDYQFACNCINLTKLTHNITADFSYEIGGKKEEIISQDNRFTSSKQLNLLAGEKYVFHVPHNNLVIEIMKLYNLSMTECYAHHYKLQNDTKNITVLCGSKIPYRNNYVNVVINNGNKWIITARYYRRTTEESFDLRRCNPPANYDLSITIMPTLLNDRDIILFNEF
jgi:histidinol phosphatase-like enzyme